VLVLKRYTRPIVRSFIPRFSTEAAEHVGAGGHAVILEAPDRARLVVTTPKGHGDLGNWAAMDIDVELELIESGPFAGLSGAVIRGSSLETVRAWCTRDSIHEGTRREMELDCTTCGACCMNNHVELTKKDVRNLVRAGHEAITREPYVRKRDGKLILALVDGRCTQLAADGLCSIYDARPSACSSFPPASEGCLYARDVERGILDGPTE
jgi:hypothetical protein